MGEPLPPGPGCGKGARVLRVPDLPSPRSACTRSRKSAMMSIVVACQMIWPPSFFSQ